MMLSTINSLDDIVDSDLCLGCGLCQNLVKDNSIKVIINKQGFYRPEKKENSEFSWHILRNICPGIYLHRDKAKNTNSHEKTWGPIQIAELGYATDVDIRWRASSGGAISALLICLLDLKIIDFVVHIGRHNAPDSFSPVVSVSYTREDIINNAGSMYLPTAPLAEIDKYLERPGKFAFVGKPCDVAALRAYAKVNPLVEEKIAVMLSFFCAGVPSKFASYDVVKALGLDVENITTFKYRGCGWPGKATAIDKAGKAHSMSYEDSWGKILGRQLQFRCKICPDGVGEFADISCFDAWHTKDGKPTFEERPGRSGILARTDKGAILLDQAKTSGYLKAISFDLSDLNSMQPAQKNRRQFVLARLLAMKFMGHAIPRYNGFYLLENSLQAGISNFFRQFLGALRRFLFQKK